MLLLLRWDLLSRTQSGAVDASGLRNIAPGGTAEQIDTFTHPKVDTLVASKAIDGISNGR